MNSKRKEIKGGFNCVTSLPVTSSVPSVSDVSLIPNKLNKEEVNKLTNLIQELSEHKNTLNNLELNISKRLDPEIKDLKDKIISIQLDNNFQIENNKINNNKDMIKILNNIKEGKQVQEFNKNGYITTLIQFQI
jgi:uncharacterized protein (DUF342 family)